MDVVGARKLFWERFVGVARRIEAPEGGARKAEAEEGGG